jgi:hypothetical protein
VGKEHGANIWHAFECKGRASPPNNSAKAKAKEQAERLVSVDGVPCSLHVGAITYFKNDALQFYWVDPPPTTRRAIEVPYSPSAWRDYYLPAWQAIGAGRLFGAADGAGRAAPLQELDIEVSVHPIVARHLAEGAWGEAQRAAEEQRRFILDDGFQADGLMVKAGDSWSRRFDEGVLG